jgi:CheY-like chemotaxis protein
MMNPTVLVVDDEAAMRNLLRRCLKCWDYDIREAPTAIDALEMMLADPASVMLCDLTLPDHDGLWLIERVRAKWPMTAIIVASGADDMEVMLKCRRAGAVDYVLKPFGRELLQQALQRAHIAISSRPTFPLWTTQP